MRTNDYKRLVAFMSSFATYDNVDSVQDYYQN